MLSLLVIENPVTGLSLEILPFIIAGVVLVAAVVFGIVMSQVSKKNKQKKKDQKNNENK